MAASVATVAAAGGSSSSSSCGSGSSGSGSSSRGSSRSSGSGSGSGSGSSSGSSSGSGRSGSSTHQPDQYQNSVFAGKEVSTIACPKCKHVSSKVYKLDDGLPAVQVGLHVVLAAQAYMLFYRAPNGGWTDAPAPRPATDGTDSNVAARELGRGGPGPTRGIKLSDWGLEVIKTPNRGYCGYQSVAKLLHCQIGDGKDFFSTLAEWGCAGGGPGKLEIRHPDKAEAQYKRVDLVAEHYEGQTLDGGWQVVSTSQDRPEEWEARREGAKRLWLEQADIPTDDRCCLNFRRYWFISEWGRYIADGAYRPLIIATVDASENVTHVSIWMHVSWDGLSTQSKSGNRKRFWQGHIEAGASLAKQVLAAFEDAICMTCTDDGKPNSVGHYSATRRTSQQPTTADSTLLDVHRRALASKEAAREKAEADAAEANATAAAAAAAKMSSLFSAVPNGLGTNDEPMSEAQLEQRRQMERTRLLNELGMDFPVASATPDWTWPEAAAEFQAQGSLPLRPPTTENSKTRARS